MTFFYQVKKPHHVVFFGQMNTGKSTLARKLKELVLGYTQTSFANPIKDMACALGAEGVSGPSKDRDTQVPGLRQGVTTRRLCQAIGEGLRRDLYPEIWTDLGQHEMTIVCDMEAGGPHATVTDDGRFISEMRMCTKYPAYFIRVRDGKAEAALPKSWRTRQKRRLAMASPCKAPGRKLGHASEVDLLGMPDHMFDFVLEPKQEDNVQLVLDLLLIEGMIHAA